MAMANGTLIGPWPNRKKKIIASVFRVSPLPKQPYFQGLSSYCPLERARGPVR